MCSKRNRNCERIDKNDVKPRIKEAIFTEVITKEYKVTDVSPEDGIVFDFEKCVEAIKRNKMHFPLMEEGCRKCKKPFKNGDRMYLAITDQGNVFLCKDCAKQIRRKLGLPDYCKPENLYLNKYSK